MRDHLSRFRKNIQQNSNVFCIKAFSKLGIDWYILQPKQDPEC